jgi:hydrogenase-4 component F
LIPVEAVLLIPVAVALASAVSPKEKWISWMCIGGALVGFIATALLCAPVFLGGEVVRYGLWYIDGLSAMFMTVTSLIALMTIMYSRGYLGHERAEKELSARSEKVYYVYLNLFVAVMLAVFAVSSLGILWIVIEATTLISTFLVGFYKDDKSTEASWKYLIICSVGITLALLGIALAYASSIGAIADESTALDWCVLMSVADQLDPALMKTATALIVVGFGTKVGLAPMHTWLPDAHSQAPTPVSALLSATLLNCAMYSILRFYAISEIAVPGLTKGLLLGFGFLSLLIAATFILRSKNIKRMLAYSSIEHMGIIAIGFGIGTRESIIASLFLVVAHSLTKPILFYSAGNMIHAYGTKEMADMKGMREKMPFTASMLALGSLAIVGMPAFSVFAGELAMIMAMVSSQWLMCIPFLILLLLVFAGFMLHIFPMLSGHTDKDVRDPPGIVSKIPFVVLAALTLLLGLFMPESLSSGFDSIVSTVFGGAI